MMLRYIVRTAIAIGLVAATAGRAEAQQWGVKGGVNLADIAWGDEILLETPMGWGAMGGAFVRLPLAGLGLQVEGLVSQLIIDLSIEDFTSKQTITYVHVPAVVRFGLFGSSVRTSVHGGAAFDIRVAANENVNGEVMSIRDSIAPWGVSLVGGADIEWGAHWVFDARYVFGMTDIYVAEVAESLPAKQRSLQFTAGWRF